jgi:hypothetical protein
LAAPVLLSYDSSASNLAPIFPACWGLKNYRRKIGMRLARGGEIGEYGGHGERDGVLVEAPIFLQV